LHRRKFVLSGGWLKSPPLTLALSQRERGFVGLKNGVRESAIPPTSDLQPLTSDLVEADFKPARKELPA